MTWVYRGDHPTKNELPLKTLEKSLDFLKN